MSKVFGSEFQMWGPKQEKVRSHETCVCIVGFPACRCQKRPTYTNDLWHHQLNKRPTYTDDLWHHQLKKRPTYTDGLWRHQLKGREHLNQRSSTHSFLAPLEMEPTPVLLTASVNISGSIPASYEQLHHPPLLPPPPTTPHHPPSPEP